ncbi:MAG TPA: hypothetical protein VNF06_03535 [Candidatus Aquilonibacter sp.]|nr:hypothetical protein [Candidatus Aquilonibacter sp.]
MREIITKTKKFGGFIFVRIPNKVAQKEGIKAGEFIRIKVTKIEKNWFGAMKGLVPFTKEDEFDEKIRQ